MRENKNTGNTCQKRDKVQTHDDIGPKGPPKLVSQVLCHFSLRSNPEQLQQFASHLEHKPVIPCWLALHHHANIYVYSRWVYVYLRQLSSLVISTQNSATTNPQATKCKLAQSTMFIFNTRVLKRT